MGGVIIDSSTRTRAEYPASSVFIFVLRLLSERCCISCCFRTIDASAGPRNPSKSISYGRPLGGSQVVHYTRWSQPHGIGAGGFLVIMAPLFFLIIRRQAWSMCSRVFGQSVPRVPAPLFVYPIRYCVPAGTFLVVEDDGTPTEVCGIWHAGIMVFYIVASERSARVWQSAYRASVRGGARGRISGLLCVLLDHGEVEAGDMWIQ